jgi:hypothetical protein
MNDFDKDELITLKNAIEYLPGTVKLSKQYLMKCDVILSKIEFMIDRIINCDHESNGIRYAVMKLSATDNREFEYKCKKCDRYFEPNKF